MGLYQRYASGDHHDGLFLQSGLSLDTIHRNSDGTLVEMSPPANTAVILPLVNKSAPDSEQQDYSISRWLKLFEYSIVFHGLEVKSSSSVFDNVIVFLYGDNNLRCLTQYGICEFKLLLVSYQSRFWPACENLVPEYRNIESRKALAIANLKQYSVLVNLKPDFPISKNWDETKAGELASTMDTVVLNERMLDLLLQLGVLQPHWITSTILDVVYNSNDTAHIADDNLIVSHVGEQLDQLFDPLLEYSPESLHKSYQTPTTQPLPENQPGPSIAPIINELLSVQTNFTMKLVDLIQKFIIPLRIEVLAANAGITKVNQVFPPTIDEITRINCILHESLTRAKPYGYVEILKAFATILPYFYKAFIRHEANVKGFGAKLKRFHEKNKRSIFENSLINQGKFSLPEIESIVVGSLLELPKFKLILQRLVKTMKQRHTDVYDMEEIEKHFVSSIEVIDAFGEAEITPEFTGRIFTPTGKILTELACNWPSELQFGWITRKAVGIFEFINIHPQKIQYNRDVVIIFSDSILFMTIEDRNYYNHLERVNEGKQLSVSDILMHSLVNQKPLPHVIPSMRVSHWCGINEVLVSAYDGPNKTNMLRILNISEAGFSTKESPSATVEYAKNYQILDIDTNAEKIMDLVNKARILFKDQPFHLFKSSNPDGLVFYSSAHELSLYKEEQCKSPFALFLNENFENPETYFEDHPYLQLIICAFLSKKDEVQIKALNRTLDYQLEKTIPLRDLQLQLQSILVENYSLMLNSFNLITQSLKRANEISLEYFADRSHDDSPIMRNASLNARKLSLKNQKRERDNKSNFTPRAGTVSLELSTPKGHLPKQSKKEESAQERKKKRHRRSWASVFCLPFKKQSLQENSEAEPGSALGNQSVDLRGVLRGRKSMESRKSMSVQVFMEENKENIQLEQNERVPKKPVGEPESYLEKPKKSSIDPKIPRRKSMEVLASVINRKKPAKEASSSEISGMGMSKLKSESELSSERYNKRADAFIPKGHKMKYTNLLTAAPALVDDNENNTTDTESAVVPVISLAPVVRGNSSSDVYYLVPARENSIEALVLDYHSSQSVSPTDTVFAQALNEVSAIKDEVTRINVPTKAIQGFVVDREEGIGYKPDITENTRETLESRISTSRRETVTDDISDSQIAPPEDLRRANSTNSSVIHVPIGSIRSSSKDIQPPIIFKNNNTSEESQLKQNPQFVPARKENQLESGSEERGSELDLDQKDTEIELKAENTAVPPPPKRTIWSKTKLAEAKATVKQEPVHRPPPKVKSVDDINMISDEQSLSDLALDFQDYYDDGTENWAIINRDNSSILNTHILLEPVGFRKDGENLRSVDKKPSLNLKAASRRVASESSHRSVMSKDSSIEEIFQDIIERYDNITLSGSQDSLADKDIYFTAANALKAKHMNLSTKSLTPSEFASQFEKDIINMFYTEDALYDIAVENDTTIELHAELEVDSSGASDSSIEFIGVREKAQATSSSEEEYYSVPEAPSDHSENVIVIEKSPARSFVSSDGTIIDDSVAMTDEKQLVPPTPPQHQTNSRIVSSNSIGYLSNYIR